MIHGERVCFWNGLVWFWHFRWGVGSCHARRWWCLDRVWRRRVSVFYTSTNFLLIMFPAAICWLCPCCRKVTGQVNLSLFHESQIPWHGTFNSSNFHSASTHLAQATMRANSKFFRTMSCHTQRDKAWMLWGNIWEWPDLMKFTGSQVILTLG